MLISLNHIIVRHRMAAVSAAYRQGVKVSGIWKVAGCSNEKTFAKFYNEPLQSNVDTTFLGECWVRSL